jgi:hypothetical protein
MDIYKKYIVQYFVALIVLSLPLMLNYLFIERAYENSSFKDIVHIQRSYDAIYGTALNQNTYAYKLELVRAVKPDVVAVGSSRIMQFREDYFVVPFVNTGGAMNYLNEGILFLEDLVKVHKPKTIILGLDFWWFNPNYPQPSFYDYHDNIGTFITFDKLTKPFTFLMDSKITLSDYAATIAYQSRLNNITQYKTLGLDAIKTSEGFRKDGSYFYAKTIFGFDDNYDDVKFQGIASRIAHGIRKFEYSTRISDERVRDLLKFLSIARENDIAVVLFLPPVSHAIYEKMRNAANKYAYVNGLRQYLKTLPCEMYDFHNIGTVHVDDCEFIDGIHGGDVVFQRLLLNIIGRNQNSALRAYLDLNLMRKSVKKYEGKVLTIYDSDSAKLLHSEVDFLKLGCYK